MTSQPVFVVASLTVVDPEIYREYERGVFKMLKRHGGEIVTYDDSIEHLEGDSPRTGRMVICKFASAADAKRWYADPEYQALSEYRRRGTKLAFLTLVHGLPARA